MKKKMNLNDYYYDSYAAWPALNKFLEHFSAAAWVKWNVRNASGVSLLKNVKTKVKYLNLVYDFH